MQDILQIKGGVEKYTSKQAKEERIEGGAREERWGSLTAGSIALYFLDLL